MVRVEVGKDRVLVDNVIELALEARQLFLGQAEASQVRDALNVLARQGCHGRRIAADPLAIGAAALWRSEDNDQPQFVGDVVEAVREAGRDEERVATLDADASDRLT